MTDIVGDQTLKSLWEERASTRAEHPFLIFQNRAGELCEYSYRSFNEEIDRTANLFLSRGVVFGDRVAVHMRTSPEFLMCLFALAKIGAVMVPMNEQNVKDECLHVLRKCSIGCVVTEPCYLGIYEEIRAEEAAGDEDVCITDILLARCNSPRPGTSDFESLKNGQPGELEVASEPDSDDIAEILFTSGTTSSPKGVMLTHANMVFSGLYGDWQVNLGQDDRLLTTMPACHSNFQLAAMTPVLTAGATLIMVEKYSASGFWAQVRKHRATVIQAVAMMVRTLLLQPLQEDEQEHCLREILYFLPISACEKRAFEQRFAVKLMNTYGSTESVTWVITDLPVGERRWPSVGRVGFSYEAKIVDEGGSELPVGKIGEILIKGVPGRTLMKGYFDDPEQTARVLSAEGWLRTDDKGYRDRDGWFYFVDRNVNMIKRAGENISSTEIEDILVGHPRIAEAAVVGIEDPIRDQAVKAFVLPAPGQKITAQEVIAYCEAHMAAFKVPGFVEFVEDFPRTCSMKIEKKLLG